MSRDFAVWPYRFRFRALEHVVFPPGKAGNILRGAFGTIFQRMACMPDCSDAQSCAGASSCPYARVFEPRQEWVDTLGPSGVADWPRPFAFRAVHLDGRRVEPGEEFWFDLVLFDEPANTLPYFVMTFREVARSGLGPGRGRAELVGVTGLPGGAAVFDGNRFHRESIQGLRLDLAAAGEPCGSVRLRFTTPTELKSGGQPVSRPEFGVLFRRLRDRVSNLRAFYQGGPLEIDFTSLAAEADRTRIVECRLREQVERRWSSRTHQRHPLGGFAGEVEYEGELGPFLGFLRAGEWTGVGRQTVWGKGCFELMPPG